MDTGVGGQREKTIPRLRVLIADDSSETRRGTRLMLSLIRTVKVVAIAQDGREAVELAKKHRPELKQSELAIEQADKSITLSRAPYLPAVTVSANYLKQGDDILTQEYPFGPSEVKTALATLEWRFWAWGQSKDEVAVAKYNMKKAQENEVGLLDNITLQVREAFLDIKEFEYNITVTEKAIEQAEEDYRINQSRYQAQLSTTTNVLDAQTRLTRARINYYNALYNYQISLMRLAWATGTLIQ